MRTIRRCAAIVTVAIALLAPASAHAFFMEVQDRDPAIDTANVTWDTEDGLTTVTPTGSGATLRIYDLNALLAANDVVIDTGIDPLYISTGIGIGSGRTLTLRGGDITASGLGSPYPAALWSGDGALVVDSSHVFETTGSATLGHPLSKLGTIEISANDARLHRSIYTTGPQTYDARVISTGQYTASAESGDITFNEGVASSHTSSQFGAHASVSDDVVLHGGFGSTKFASVSIGGDEFHSETTDIPSNDITIAAKWALPANFTMTQCSALTTFPTTGPYDMNIPSGCYGYGWSVAGDIDVSSINSPVGEFYLLNYWHPTVRGATSVNVDLVRGLGTIQSNGTIRVRRFEYGADVALETPGQTRLELTAPGSPAKITTDAPGTNTLGGTFSATDSVTLAGASTLAAATTLGGASPISITSVVGGSQAFTTSSTGGTTIGTASGTFGAVALGGSAVSLAGSMQSTSTLMATAPLTLTGATSLGSTGGAVTLTSDINGAHAVTTSSTSSTRFGRVGNTTPPTSVTATGATRLSEDIRTTGTFDITGSLTLDAGADVEATELDVTGAVDLGNGASGTHVLDGAGELDGGLIGAGSLRKEGGGELVIGGPTTNANRIVVAEGSVRANASLASLSEIELDGGTVTGTGQLPDIRGTEGTIRPGVNGVGRLPIGAARLTADTTLEIGVDSGTPAVLGVTGSVDLDGAELELTGSPTTLAVGDVHVIVDNNGSDPVSQTFAGIDEGEIVEPAPGVRVMVSYQGGTNANDITIRRIGSSTTDLVASAVSSRAGEGVTLTATVTGASTSSPGDVRFYDGVVLVGAATPVGGTAELLVTNLAAGVHALSAAYDGDADTDPSSSAQVTHTIVARVVLPPVQVTPIVPLVPVVPVTPVVPATPMPDIDTSAPRVLVTVGKPVTFARSAQPTITLTLRCEATETSCTYSLLAETSERARGKTRRIELGEDDVEVPGGATRTVKLRLNAAAKTRLVRSGRLSVRLEITAADPDENAATVMRTVALKRSGR